MSTLFLAATSKSSSGSWLPFLLIIAFGAVYFFVLRPRQKAQQAARAQGNHIDIGDTVVTIGGVRGVVVALDDDQVTIATGQMPGDDPSNSAMTHITFIRKAIGQKITPPAPDVPVTEAPTNEITTGDASPEADAGQGPSENS